MVLLEQGEYFEVLKPSVGCCDDRDLFDRSLRDLGFCSDEDIVDLRVHRLIHMNLMG